MGEKISQTFETEKCLSEHYLADMNRVFFGEQQLIENIEPDKETFIIFELINITNSTAGVQSMELVGWTVLRLFNDDDSFV